MRRLSTAGNQIKLKSFISIYHIAAVQHSTNEGFNCQQCSSDYIFVRLDAKISMFLRLSVILLRTIVSVCSKFIFGIIFY